MNHALLQQLLGTIEDNFFRVLHRQHLGYSRSSTLDLITHLYEAYSVITNADWLANNKHFHEAYAPTNPIEVVLRQIYNTVAYTNEGSLPYSNKHVIDNNYQLVFNTGVFAADYRE